MTKKKDSKRIRIGPLLLQVLEQQIKQVKEVCYDVVDTEYYEAGEIVAKKLLK